MKLTAERLRYLLHYNPETGQFTRLVSTGTAAKAGDVAGSISKKDGYCRIFIDGVSYMAHRLAWLYMTGDWPKKEMIDHINMVRNDNRWCNLREATRSENNGNRDPRRDCSSGIKGVYFRKESGRWRSFIDHDRTRYNLGTYDTVEAAAMMFEGAAKLLRGSFHKEQKHGN